MKKLLLTSAIALSALTFGTAVQAEDGFTDTQKAEIEKMFDAYILDNGDKIMEAIQKSQIEAQARQLEEAKENISNAADYLYNSGSPSFGPEDADVTIVEFFDYNCGYCRKALDEIQTVMDDDKKVRVVFKEMPILSPASREAAQWALAADKQDKYFEYHVALMEHNGAKSPSVYKKIAEDLKLDVKQLEKDKDSAEIAAIIDKNLEMSGKLGVRGTPAFIIDDQFSPGYIPAAQMKRIIETVRENNG